MPGEQWTDTEDRDLLDFLYNELRSRDPTRKENAQLYRGNRVWKRYVEMNPDTKRSFQSLQSHFRRHVWGEKFCYLNYPPEKLFYLIKHLGQTVKSEDKQWLEKRWPYKLVISTKGFLQEYKRDTSPRKKPAEDLDESEETPRKKKRNALETSTSEVPDSQPPSINPCLPLKRQEMNGMFSILTNRPILHKLASPYHFKALQRLYQQKLSRNA
ncbi:unnamed protein product, partial [Mesorhabditis belari]|uniref:Uncharacterized protein n=1 Tax=Mesorhabditis belari TaxID=2138241 RepID=A0AAF3F3E7_9BILA